MFYTLENKKVIACTVDQFVKDLKNRYFREIARTQVNGKRATVITVFCGMNHGLFDDDPLFFETMVFGGSYDSQVFRSSSYQEAEEMHETIVDRVKNHKRAWYSPGGPSIAE
jgi:hypothetical protein